MISKTAKFFIKPTVWALCALSFIAPFFAMAAGIYASTYSPETIGNDCAVLRGNVSVSTGANDTISWFEYGNASYHFAYATAWHRVSGSGENLSTVISVLKPNTVYYARMVSENSQGRVYGNEISFKTGSGKAGHPFSLSSCVGSDGSVINGGTYAGNNGGYTNYGNTGNVAVAAQSVATINASDITETSARLNAVIFPTSGAQTSSWFEWGKTPDLGNKTARTIIGQGVSLRTGENIQGLLPGTTYFFKPVIQSAYGTNEGLLFSFRTNGVPPVVAVSAVNKKTDSAGYVAKTEQKTVTNVKANEKTGKKTSGTVSSGETDKNADATENAGKNALAAAGSSNGASPVSFRGWVMLVAHMLLFGALYFFFIFFSQKSDDETPRSDIAATEGLSPVLVAVPVEKRAEPEKRGAPPANLPI